MAGRLLLSSTAGQQLALRHSLLATSCQASVAVQCQRFKTNKLAQAGPKIDTRKKPQPLPTHILRPDIDEVYGFMGDGSHRTGLMVKKLGMSMTFNPWGQRLAITHLEVLENIIVGHRTEERDGYSAVRLAYETVSEKKLNKAQLGIYRQLGVQPRRHIVEFRVTEDCLVPLGTVMSSAHFMPGQLVDVIGTSIGKGFQGVMKRHNFKGMPMSHGVTKTHRKGGGLGGGQDPGRVLKGKKMPGRMGGKKAMQQNLLVYRVDTRWNVITVVGSVPGPKNGVLKIEDARWAPPLYAAIPTFPVHDAEDGVFEVPPQYYDPLK